MWKTNKVNRLDKLAFRHEIEVSKAYKNISKHKRILAPVVQSAITLYVNEQRLNEDEGEVFVVPEFFRSLALQGKFPMYTCTCGIFGCGGFYIHVLHKNDTVIWETEQSSVKTYSFAKDNILNFGEELIQALVGLNEVLNEHGLPNAHEIDEYKSNLSLFARSV